MSRPFGQITPILPSWRNNNSGSARNRAAEIRMAPPSGSGRSSPTWTKSSRVISPPLTSGIDTLLERLDAEPLHRIDEELLAILFDAENADMADMMMAAGVDAAGDVDMESADQICGVMIGKAPRQLL